MKWQGNYLQKFIVRKVFLTPLLRDCLFMKGLKAYALA